MTFKNFVTSPFQWIGAKASSAAQAISQVVQNALPFVPGWLRVKFIDPTFQRMAREGYKASSVVYACVTLYARKFPEPPIRALGLDDKPILKHPVLDLIRKPNRWMNEARFMICIIIYMLIGGDVYVHKLRNRSGNVIGLRPLHAGQVVPVPTPEAFIDHYLFSIGDGKYQEIASEDVIHIQWPSIDPEEVWKSYPPLLAVAREVDSTAEVARYTYALFKNDATPLTVVSYPKETNVTDADLKAADAKGNERFGGDNRGSMMFLRGGATVTRLGLGLKELDSENALNVPQALIASAFGIPPIILGLPIGLKRATFANYQEARAAFTEDTLCPLWRLVEDALTIGLQDDFSQAFQLRFDLDRVVALRDNADVVHKQTLAEWMNGVITLNEARADFNREALPDEEGNVFYFDVMIPTTLQPVSALQPVQDPASDTNTPATADPEVDPTEDQNAENPNPEDPDLDDSPQITAE